MIDLQRMWPIHGIRTLPKPAVAMLALLALPHWAWSQRAEFEPPRSNSARAVERIALGRDDTRSGKVRQDQRSRQAVTQREYMVETADRWKLVARRFVAKNSNARRLPVILCHGFTFNGRFFDLRPEIDLATYLAESDFDVWVVDLRGCGKSHKWAVTASGGGDLLIGRLADKLVNKGVPATGYVSLDLRFAQWTFDDHVDRDIPALLNLVVKETGMRNVAWLGHSMGGNAMLAYLAKNGQDARIAKVATVGSQVTMSQGRLMVEFLAELLAQREAQLRGRRMAATEVFNGATNVFYNQRNVDERVMRSFAAMQEAPSVGLLRQYLDLAQSGKLRSSNRSFDYSANLGKIRCPLLIAGGAADQIAPPTDQITIYERATAANKTMMILGRALGLRSDYGHCDALVGPEAQSEVYPRLANWLAK